MDEPGWSETAADREWVWREDRGQALLTQEDADVLFVSGCASNQVKFYQRFDEIILLSAMVRRPPSHHTYSPARDVA